MSESLLNKISITGVNESQSHQDLNDPEKCIYAFNLSLIPPSEWVRGFNEAWRRRRQSGMSLPDADIQGQLLKLYCRCEQEIDLFVDNLILDVEMANQTYQELRAQKAQEQTQEAEKKDQSKQLIKDRLGKLKF